MTRRIVFASGNVHKLQEVNEILQALGIEVCPPHAYGGLPEVIEDQDSFAGNAIKKAISACEHTGDWALADASGIEARALAGAPGVYSARYAGPDCDDARNNAKLVREMAHQVDKPVKMKTNSDHLGTNV